MPLNLMRCNEQEGIVMAVKYVFVTGGVVSGLGRESPLHRWAVC